jgi:uncharacterized membrane protein
MDPNGKPNQDTFDEWHNDPSNWKLGVFYFNPKDKRIFPPKRLKSFGWTVNFANPLSVLALLIIILAFILVLSLST